MANVGVPGQVQPSNVIALTSAAIGVVSGFASHAIGLDHAKSVYEAATGSAAGFSEYLQVGGAFWDGFPIAAAVAATVGLLVYGVYLNPAYWRQGMGLIAVGAAFAGGQVDGKHLAAYKVAAKSGASDSASVLRVFVEVYGPLASLLAVIAGVGAAVALWLKANKT